MEENIAIGIDLGTTFSLAAVVQNGAVSLIKDEQSSTFMRSIVAFDGERVQVGKAAEERRVVNPEFSFYSFKRFMGRSFTEISSLGLKLPYLLSRGKRDNIILGEKGFVVSPEELSAHVLREIKVRAEQILNQNITKAVITVPAYFEEPPRQATRDAALRAGLEPLRLITEPTAAAVAYGLDNKKNCNILVYDLGGGTFDVTVLKLLNNVFRVLATNGDNNLGGDDFDYCISQIILKQAGVDESTLSPSQQQSLKIAAEQAKIKLTSTVEVEIVLPDIAGAMKITITRHDFEEKIKAIVGRTFDHIKKALADAKLAISEIDEVVLVGGSSRVPLVRSSLAKELACSINTRIDPDQVVAYGAAIQASSLSGGEFKHLLLDVIPLSLGIETLGGVFSKLILKHASLPAKHVETFSTAVDGQTSVDLNIYQGERELVENCRLVGRFKLRGIPKMPAGLPKIEVEFLVDSNGILNVSAIEQRSLVKAEIDIIPEHGLTRGEVNKMIEDSIDFAAADMEKRMKIELIQSAQSIVAGLEKSNSKIQEILPAAEYKNLQKDIESVKAAIAADSENLKDALASLQELSQPLADQLISDSISAQLKGADIKS